VVAFQLIIGVVLLILSLFAIWSLFSPRRGRKPPKDKND
jgi:di/tricarboxylate transporter